MRGNQSSFCQKADSERHSFYITYSETPRRTATNLGVLPRPVDSKQFIAHQAPSPRLLDLKDLAHSVATRCSSRSWSHLTRLQYAFLRIEFHPNRHIVRRPRIQASGSQQSMYL